MSYPPKKGGNTLNFSFDKSVRSKYKQKTKAKVPILQQTTAVVVIQSASLDITVSKNRVPAIDTDFLHNVIRDSKGI